MEKFLKQFSNLLDNKEPEPPLFSNPNQIEENQSKFFYYNKF